MKAHHLQLNLSKIELLVFPAKPTIHHSICIQTESLSLAPSKVARNLGVMIDDQLTFKHHVASVAWLCRFALLNIIKIRPYLTQHATQLLVKAMVISHLDYCNALLTGLPACAVKPLQMVQNAAAHLVFNQPKRAHVTPLFIELHWLPLAAHIKFKSLMLAYKVLNGTAHIYLNALAKAYVTTRSLRSSQDCRLAVPTPRLRQSESFHASFHDGGMTYWALPEQGRPCLSSINSWRPSSSESISYPSTSLTPLLHALFLYFPLCLHSISTLSPLTEPD